MTVGRLIDIDEILVTDGFNYEMELELVGGEMAIPMNCKVTVFDHSWIITDQVIECSCCGSSWTPLELDVDGPRITTPGQTSKVPMTTAKPLKLVKELTTIKRTTTSIPNKLKPEHGGHITGGDNSADVNDVRVKEMASFAVATVSKSLNSAQPLTVVRIISVQTQVVSGMNYKMELELKEGKKKSINCHVDVYDQSWTNTRKVTKCSCCGSSWKSVDNRPTTTTTTISPSTDEEASIITETAVIKDEEKEMTDAPAPIDGDVSGD